MTTRAQKNIEWWYVGMNLMLNRFRKDPYRIIHRAVCGWQKHSKRENKLTNCIIFFNLLSKLYSEKKNFPSVSSPFKSVHKIVCKLKFVQNLCSWLIPRKLKITSLQKTRKIRKKSCEIHSFSFFSSSRRKEAEKSNVKRQKIDTKTFHHYLLDSALPGRKLFRISRFQSIFSRDSFFRKKTKIEIKNNENFELIITVDLRR